MVQVLDGTANIRYTKPTPLPYELIFGFMGEEKKTYHMDTDDFEAIHQIASPRYYIEIVDFEAESNKLFMGLKIILVSLVLIRVIAIRRIKEYIRAGYVSNKHNKITNDNGESCTIQ